MSTNHTQYYGLSQWEPDDKVLREDFNRDNRIIDEAMWKFGSCQVVPYTYKGDGETSRSWTFSANPMFFIIQGGGASMMAIRGSEVVLSRHSQGGGLLNLVWEKISDITYTVTWTAQSGSALDACNQQYTMYKVLAFYDMWE